MKRGDFLYMHLFIHAYMYVYEILIISKSHPTLSILSPRRFPLEITFMDGISVAISRFVLISYRILVQKCFSLYKHRPFISSLEKHFLVYITMSSKTKVRFVLKTKADCS